MLQLLCQLETKGRALKSIVINNISHAFFLLIVHEGNCCKICSNFKSSVNNKQKKGLELNVEVNRDKMSILSDK